MVSNESFQDFLVNPQVNIEYSYLLIALITAAVLAYILGKLYVRYGTSLSNRKQFSSNFVLLSITTTFIIMVVKSSLALSLGLVGALSIVRFRAAIKEPEELIFLFILIAIGLGLGAGQFNTTLISFLIVSIVIYGRSFFKRKETNKNLYLNISGKEITLNQVITVLDKYCNEVNLRRFDKLKEGSVEASFLVDFDSVVKLEKTTAELEKISPSISITYLENSVI